jgi:ATP phosphoribosyltransferase regulatory subunit
MKLPAGVRDWLPEELKRKRAVEATIRSVFERFGYDEVETPAIERYDTLLAGLGDHVAAQTYRFDDRRGTQLALRPEMTTSIARLVSTRMRDRLPLRLGYISRAFRFEEPQEGRMREFTQAGVELIGASDRAADAEALFTAVTMIDDVALPGAQFDINHVAIVDGVLESLNIPIALTGAVKGLLATRNLVGLRELLSEKYARASKTLFELALARGTGDLLNYLAPFCTTETANDGLQRLRDLLRQAKERGLGDRITVDFTLLRGLGYYTGFVFEGYVGDLGFPLCGGGRYDDLLPKFGLVAPAIGWSAGIERILIALERKGQLH